MEHRKDNMLEFDQIKNKLARYACTEAAKEEIRKMEPILVETELRARIRETTEARLILEKYGNPPQTAMQGIGESLQIAGKGGCLDVGQLEEVAAVLTAVRRMQDFLNRCKQLDISLPYYEENLNSLDDIREEINRVIRNGRVDDYATKDLRNLRSAMERAEEQMREKAEITLRTYRNYLSDQFCTMKNGYLCIPLKKEYKGKVEGIIADKSSTGSTLFVEPAGVARYRKELEDLRIEEENEVLRILYTLSALLADVEDIFRENARIMGKLDFIFARGKLSLELNGTEPVMVKERKISIQKGRHPLLSQEICVPLDFQMQDEIRGVIITGPNTGGKTVAIKTVGLICLMAQCGLHVTCQKAELCMHDRILCDIGDGQNLEENLSTFSAHIRNILDILKKTDRQSLVILDELGSGTDPAEGMGIAIAILEELRKSGAFFLATTHYPEVKKYAEKTENIVNARMSFDRNTLKPLYRMEIGKAGESCALHIAGKLGMPMEMLDCAARAAYGQNLDENFMSHIVDTKIKTLEKMKLPGLRVQKRKIVRQEKADQFKLGDSVMVYPDKKKGIVCQVANDKGILRIQLPDKKIWISHKRIRLLVASQELYPADYDFSIIFDSVENRKARHKMEKRYAPEAEIRREKEEL